MSAEITAADLGLEPVRAELSVAHARRLAATLDVAEDLAEGSPVPLLWHWAFFVPDAPTTALGADGHPRLPDAAPTAGLPRRMWAGGRVRSHGELLLGRPAERRSEVVRAERKSGRSGELLVVTVAHEVRQDGELRISEEQDLIYRAASSEATPAPEGDEQPEVPPGGWCDRLAVGPPMLFRYSALTFNSHRIHYDEPYATAVEGYPGLVVHGPLTATLLVESARRNGRSGDRFSFRAAAPLFADLPFTIVGAPGDDGVRLEALRNDGQVAMSAELS